MIWMKLQLIYVSRPRVCKIVENGYAYLSGGSANIDPSLREEGTRSKHEYNVNDSMDRISDNVTYRFRRGQIVT